MSEDAEATATNDFSSYAAPPKPTPRANDAPPLRFSVTIPKEYEAGASMKLVVDGNNIRFFVPSNLPENRTVTVDENGNLLDELIAMRFEVLVPDKKKPGDAIRMEVAGKIIKITCPKNLPDTRKIIVDGTGTVIENEVTKRFMVTVPEKYEAGHAMKMELEPGGKVIRLYVPKNLPANRTIIVDSHGRIIEDEVLADKFQAPMTVNVNDYSSSITSGAFRGDAVAQQAHKPRSVQLMRSLSFSRSNSLPTPPPPQSPQSASPAVPTKRLSLLRSLSFERKPKTDDFFEADIFKESPDTPLGIRIAEPEDTSLKGVVISHIDWASPTRAKLLPGDLIMKVNGVAIGNREAALAAIKPATGIILLSLMRRPMPPGWKWRAVMYEGEIQVLYKNKKEGKRILSHPNARYSDSANLSMSAVSKVDKSAVASAAPTTVSADHEEENSDSEEEAHATEPPSPRPTAGDSKDGVKARNAAAAEASEHAFRSTSL